jgi:integrase
MSYNLDTSTPPHTILRGSTYYLNLRVPKAQQQLHGQIIRSKLSSDRDQANMLADHVVRILKKAWVSHSNSKIDVEQLIASARPRTFLMSELIDEYVATRQIDPNPIRVAARSLFEIVGDRDVRSYTRDDARAFLFHLNSSGNKTSTVRKRLVCVGAVINYAYQELEVEKRNPFSKMIIVGEGKDAARRGTFTKDQLIDGYQQAFASSSNIQLLFPILGETGCRLAEIVGLKVDDIDLDEKVLRIRPNAKRRLKTSGSERLIPLNATALLALKRATEMTKSEWLFPRYIKDDGFYATHASNALAKWTKRRWGMTAHSLRHTFRDRLRAAEVPLEAIDQLGGWSSVSNIGSRYGKGYSVEHLREYMERIVVWI